MRMWMVDFIGRKSVIEMKRSGIEIHDNCLSCTLKIAYKKLMIRFLIILHKTSEVMLFNKTFTDSKKTNSKN